MNILIIEFNISVLNTICLLELNVINIKAKINFLFSFKNVAFAANS